MNDIPEALTIMKKLIVTTFLGLGIAAALPAGCIPGTVASSAPAQKAPSTIVVPS